MSTTHRGSELTLTTFLKAGKQLQTSVITTLFGTKTISTISGQQWTKESPDQHHSPFLHISGRIILFTSPGSNNIKISTRICVFPMDPAIPSALRVRPFIYLTSPTIQDNPLKILQRPGFYFEYIIHTISIGTVPPGG